MEYQFIKLTEEYFDEYLKLSMGLSDHLQNLQTFEDERIMWQRKHFFEWNDEFAYLCMYNGEAVGFIACCNYHCLSSSYCDSDGIGIISDIYVKRDHQNGGENAYALLQLGLSEMIENGKNKAIMMVQGDNPNKVFHFAMADTLVEESTSKRRDGSITEDYVLLISDLEKLQNTSKFALLKKVTKIIRGGLTPESANLKKENIFEQKEVE